MFINKILFKLRKRTTHLRLNMLNYLISYLMQGDVYLIYFNKSSKSQAQLQYIIDIF
jgi:hypothetical protein